MEKITWDGPEWGQEVLFPPNPNVADILGDMDLDLRIPIFYIFWIPNFWISRPQILRIGPFKVRWRHLC